MHLKPLFFHFFSQILLLLPFGPFFFGSLMFLVIVVLVTVSDCSDCPEKKKNYRSLEISTKNKRKIYEVQDHNETYDARPL